VRVCVSNAFEIIPPPVVDQGGCGGNGGRRRHRRHDGAPWEILPCFENR